MVEIYPNQGRAFQRSGRIKANRCSGSVRYNSVTLVLSYFNSGSGQFDETTQQIGDSSNPPFVIPKHFPNLVSFPVITRVEEIKTTAISRRLSPPVVEAGLVFGLMGRFSRPWERSARDMRWSGKKVVLH